MMTKGTVVISSNWRSNWYFRSVNGDEPQQQRCRLLSKEHLFREKILPNINGPIPTYIWSRQLFNIKVGNMFNIHLSAAFRSAIPFHQTCYFPHPMPPIRSLHSTPVTIETCQPEQSTKTDVKVDGKSNKVKNVFHVTWRSGFLQPM